MAVEYFTDINAWRQAVAKRNLVIKVYCSAEGPDPDDLWEPSWAIQLSADGMIYDDSPMYGCFLNIPTDEQGATYVSEGFLCDTELEFAYEMHKDEERHDALQERQMDKPTLH